MVGTEEARLVVLRGNSASGESSVAAAIRERFGRGLALVGDETVARHATKPIADDVSEAQLRDWYRSRDVLPGGVETVIGADSPRAATVDHMRDTGLAGLPAVDR
ncbi:hypothetical protein ABZZ80_31795 [Streptomyces sp. NPDC006356]